MLKKSLSTLTGNLRIHQASLSSKATSRVLGFNEKPNELEIKADFIGKQRKIEEYKEIEILM